MNKASEDYIKNIYILKQEKARLHSIDIAKEYGLLTNDYLIGVGYTGMMDDQAIEYGLKVLDEACLAEALIHPCKYARDTRNQHYTEFLITQNKDLKDKIDRLGFELTNYKKLIETN